MIKKTLILGLVIFGLLSFSTLNVTAVEDELEDVLDDVIYTDEDSNVEEVSDKPNLDIEKLYWGRNGQAVTLTLTVKGSIEDEGSLEIWRLGYDTKYAEEKLEEFGEDTEALLAYFESLIIGENIIKYGFLVETVENLYEIFYVNEEFLITDSYSTELVPGDFDVDGSDLTITFDLIDEGDKIANLSVDTMEFTETTAYADNLLGEAESITKETTDTNDDKGSPGFEMIAVITAIAIAFIILRRKK